jgi:hypothetical protein
MEQSGYKTILYGAHVLGAVAILLVIAGAICLAAHIGDSVFFVAGISSIISGIYLHLMANVALAIRDIAKNSRREVQGIPDSPTVEKRGESVSPLPVTTLFPAGRFLVTGVEKSTGKERTYVSNASTQDLAIKGAIALGIDLATLSIDPVETDP